MVDAHIKFDPQKIEEIANLILHQESKYIQSINLLSAKNEEMESVWSGDTAKAYYQKAKEIEKRLKAIDQAMLAFVGELFNVAGVYWSSERVTQMNVDILPTEGVFK